MILENMPNPMRGRYGHKDKKDKVTECERLLMQPGPQPQYRPATLEEREPSATLAGGNPRRLHPVVMWDLGRGCSGFAQQRRRDGGDVHGEETSQTEQGNSTMQPTAASLHDNCFYNMSFANSRFLDGQSLHCRQTGCIQGH